MKSVTHSWETVVLLTTIALTVLSLSQPAFSQVNLAGSWATGTSHTKEAGTDRALIFIAHGELTSSMNLGAVTYGGQSMAKVIDRNYYSGTGAYAYVAAYILNEAGVATASSGTFSVTWSATPSEVKYASVFLSNVNQTTLTGASASGGGTTNPVTTSALATSDGDMVIDAATCGNTGTYTLNNGFNQGTYQSSGSSTGVTGYKSATGSNETPSVTHSSVNRQALIGFVVQTAPPDPNKATNPNPTNGKKDVSVSTDLSWLEPTGFIPTSYDVYFGTDSNAHSNPKYTVDTNSYDPTGDLLLGTTYHWAVDSNDNGTIYTGDPWSFTTFRHRDRVVGNMMLINDNGGWCWYQDDKIIYDPVGGNILTSTAAVGSGFGGVGGTRTNDMDATTFNIATGKRTRVVAHEGFGGDDHNMGAFWIRPDGRYLHVYCSHYNDQITYYRLATNPNDGSSWGSEQTYNWLTIPGSPGSDSMTSSYTNVHYMSGEGTGNGRLYNIIRIFDRTPCISYSDDWGQTWNYMGRLNQPTVSGYSNFYHKFRGNGVDRIDFIGCEAHPTDFNNSIYHGYIKNGKSYNSYGTEIDSTLYDQTAPKIGMFTPVFIAGAPIDGSHHTAWTNEIEVDSDGHPVCLFQTRYGTTPYGTVTGNWGNTGAGDHRFFYGRFDGSDWNITELGKMGTGLHPPQQDYIGMGCIHPDDVNIIYISTPFDPRDDAELEHYEIFKGITYDNGATWDWTQITIDSTVDNIRPAIPQWDANNTAVFWTRGVYPEQEQYDFVVVGMVEEENKTLGLVTYTDANRNNTTNADGSPFSPTGPSGSPGAVDSQWHEYTGYGNGGSCYTAGDSGTENAPTIKTTISGLADGTYDVFAYFWCDPTADWGVRGGFESSDLLCFNKQSSQHAEASQFSGSVTVLGSGVALYRVYIGRKAVSGGTPVVVYLDNYDSTYSGNVPTRTTYDGVGVASVITGAIPGDLNGDGKVNLIDIAVLGQGWLTTYDIYTLADITDNWLIGI
jgi:hypothetical protein